MSPDEAAFLKAISDNPADETARLVYADWLADRDDPRAAFARLSAEFLRSVRGLADARRTLPAEWVGAVDPLFGRFHIVRLANAGEGIEGGTVTAVFALAGGLVVPGRALVEVSTDKATMEITAEHAGVVVSVHVRPGDPIRVGQPLVTYLSLQESFPSVAMPLALPPLPPPPIPTIEPQIPREPLVAFIQELERNRELLRAALPERINRRIATITSAAWMVFGGQAVAAARMTAEANRGWGRLSSLRLETHMRNRGYTDEQMVQEQLDIHIEMLRVLLAAHGQPDRFRELPDSDSPATE